MGCIAAIFHCQGTYETASEILNKWSGQYGRSKSQKPCRDAIQTWGCVAQVIKDAEYLKLWNLRYHVMPLLLLKLCMTLGPCLWLFNLEGSVLSRVALFRQISKFCDYLLSRYNAFHHAVVLCDLWEQEQIYMSNLRPYLFIRRIFSEIMRSKTFWVLNAKSCSGLNWGIALQDVYFEW